MSISFENYVLDLISLWCEIYHLTSVFLCDGAPLSHLSNFEPTCQATTYPVVTVLTSQSTGSGAHANSRRPDCPPDWVSGGLWALQQLLAWARVVS